MDTEFQIAEAYVKSQLENEEVDAVIMRGTDVMSEQTVVRREIDILKPELEAEAREIDRLSDAGNNRIEVSQKIDVAAKRCTESTGKSFLLLIS